MNQEFFKHPEWNTVGDPSHADVQPHAEPDRPKAALLGTRAASRHIARLAWALGDIKLWMT